MTKHIDLVPNPIQFSNSDVAVTMGCVLNCGAREVTEASSRGHLFTYLDGALQLHWHLGVG